MAEDNSEIQEESPIAYFVNLIASMYQQASDVTEADIVKTAEELLLRWSSTPPSLLDVNEFVTIMRTKGLEPTLLPSGSSFDTVYLLKLKST